MHQTGWLRRTFVLTVLTASFPLSGQVPSGAGGNSAPIVADAPAFLREVKRRIPLDVERQSGYVCLQRETEVRLDGDGRPTSRSVREYETYPSPDGGPPYRRLVARDGVPVPPSELAEGDRRRQAEIDSRLRGFEKESPGEREKRLRHAADERRERQALVDEIFRLFDFRVLATETVAGRSAVLVGFTPRPGLVASGRLASLAQKFAGKAWVDQQDLEVIQVEARSIEDLNYGLGMFARVYKGTTVHWERRKVDGDAWMPARMEIKADARLLLFRRLGLRRITDYLDYRRLTAGAGATAALSR
jgi:hypothetical protein